MEKTKPKKYTFFIGTDISRNKLDHAVMQGSLLLFHREIQNTPGDISAFIAELKEIKGFTVSKAIFCMEQTGIYGNHLLSALKKIKANTVVEGPAQIRNSLGNVRGKYDKIDAIRIAAYAYRFRENLRLWVPKRPIVQQLADLSSLRSRILSLQVALKTPLEEQTTFKSPKAVKESNLLCKRSAEALNADIAEIESYMSAAIAGDERLKRLMHLITSVACIGPLTAIQIMVCTNEFRDISSPKKFACYAGVAPFVKESGIFKGKGRLSPMANKKMKSLLHICAISAIRRVPELQAYYNRKTMTEGKSKMSVLNAVRYKLILRVFACVNQDRPYEQVYQRISLNLPEQR